MEYSLTLDQVMKLKGKFQKNKNKKRSGLDKGTNSKKVYFMEFLYQRKQTSHNGLPRPNFGDLRVCDNSVSACGCNDSEQRFSHSHS